MSSYQNLHWVQAFRQGIRILAQQRGSRLREAVDVDPSVTGDRAFYDTMQLTSMVPITDRHGKTQITDTVLARRMVTLSPFEKADLVDQVDLRRVLNDPTSSLAVNFGYAAGRQMDDAILAAFAATSLTGQTGTVSVTLPAANRIDLSGIVAGTQHTGLDGANFKLTTLTTARQVLEAFDNDSDAMDFSWHCAWRSVDRNAVFQITTPNPFTSSDYATVKALVNGELNTFLGFNFHRTERLLATVGGISGGTSPAAVPVDVPFWVKASMKLALAQDAKVSIKERVDLRESMQVRMVLDIGATRLDELGVVIAEINSVIT
jgi:hypothetical protein